ncbi:MAG: CHRD domain-containing protein [Verrucomicrobia bacterium]|nr:CHRD domain-containing protein [Verrucomicrobiota bacterium]
MTTFSSLKICRMFGASALLALGLRAQVIEFRAAITGAQEVPAVSSPGTGSAVLLYDLGTNTFDLFLTLTNFPNNLVDAHLFEASAGANGASALIHFPLSAFARSGNTVIATILRRAYPGDRLRLLQNGAYLNFHTPQFPGGEIRGQLIARPKRLVATLAVAQEQAAFPAVNLAGANLADFGGAVMSYDPGTNRISLRVSVFNFRNTLNNSHYHEGAPGVSGGVVLSLGNNANAGGYTNASGFIAGTFDLPYTGDPIKLLTGGAYLNFHSTTFAGGEVRGQVRATEEVPSSRMFSTSTRGFVGGGGQALISGISIVGPDPVRMLITAKGPSLAGYGVTGTLADPFLELFDAAGRQIAFNDNLGAVAAGSDFATLPGVPTVPVESALLVVLPPGNYTAVVTGNGGTGVALLEATDLRIVGATAAVAAAVPEIPLANF